VLVAVGGFSHLDRAGPNRLGFTGRVGNRALKPGKYVIRAVPRTASPTGQPARATFTIKVS